MGKGFRPFGHIESHRIYESGVVLALSEVGVIGVENELCFQFEQTVSMSASESELKDCIGCVRPAFELNERRLDTSATAEDRLADNLSQWGIVCGKAVPDWRQLDFEALEVKLYRDSELEASILASGHIDNHLDSLQALVRTLGRFGLQIEAGSRVITGAFGRSLVTGPSRWRGDFGSEIGSVEVEWQ